MVLWFTQFLFLSSLHHLATHVYALDQPVWICRLIPLQPSCPAETAEWRPSEADSPPGIVGIMTSMKMWEHLSKRIQTQIPNGICVSSGEQPATPTICMNCHRNWKFGFLPSFISTKLDKINYVHEIFQLLCVQRWRNNYIRHNARRYWKYPWSIDENTTQMLQLDVLFAQRLPWSKM